MLELSHSVISVNGVNRSVFSSVFKLIFEFEGLKFSHLVFSFPFSVLLPYLSLSFIFEGV